MKQKKSNLWIYIVLAAFVGLVLYVASHEAPIKQEQVEQTLDNTFLDK